MRSPWGSYFGTTGAWVNTGSSLTVTDMTGPVGGFEVVAAMTNTGNPPTSVTATSGGGAFSLITSASSGLCGLWIYGRILTDTTTHSVTASGGGFALTGGTFYKRLSSYVLLNPMNIPYSEISAMWKKVEVYDTDGSGTTTYFPDCTDLKTSGAVRTDIGVATRQYNVSGGTQIGGSTPWESWNTANVNGFYSTPYYAYTNGNGVSWGTTTATQLEDIGRRTYSAATFNMWADGGFGKIPYTNKCYNTSSSSYVSLNSQLAGVSFVIPNYGGTQMVL